MNTITFMPMVPVTAMPMMMSIITAMTLGIIMHTIISVPTVSAIVTGRITDISIIMMCPTNTICTRGRYPAHSHP